jgi:hypothetical protein
VLQSVNNYQLAMMQDAIQEQKKNDDIQKQQMDKKLNSEIANLQRKNTNEKIELKKLLTSKAITQAEYDKRILQLDETTKTATLAIQTNYDNAKAKIDNDAYDREKEFRQKSAEFQKLAAITEATITVAMLAFEAAAKGFLDPFANFKLAAATLKAGLLVATPIPQYELGGPTSVIGSNTGKTYQAKNIGTFKGGGKYTSASYGIIGEEGAELVVPNWLYTHPKMFDTMNFLEYSISKGKAFASGGNTIGAKGVEYVSNSTDPLLAQLMHQNNQLLVQNNQLQAAILQRMQNPIPAVITYDQLTESNERMNEIQQMSGL